MPSLTPLHETYCKWDRTPPSQADVLEGLAQLFSTSLNGVHELIQVINIEVLKNAFGISVQNAKNFQKRPFVQKLYQFSYGALQKYGSHFLAPSLRHIIEKYPTLHEKPLTPSQHFLVGILNGIFGDYLLKQHSPLALPMVLYDHYGAIQQGELAGRIVILAHGLCMNHLTWSNAHYGGIGERLLAQRDHNTMLYLNYNTGRRISANGRSFSNLLEDLVQRNPRITSIDIIGHSMGGLVSRSALFYGKQNMYQWIHMVENLVCIGSPHHGAVLERFGFAIQDKLGAFPFVGLLGQLVNIRSNGILDLRHGSVRDDDWEYMDARIGMMDDNRAPAPLPSHINTFLVAGTLEFEKVRNKALTVIGDYLVSVKSALGEHPNPRFQLKVPDSHKAVFYGLNHFEIQYHSSVAEQITRWLYPHANDYVQDGIQTHIIDMPNYTLEDLEGIVET
ncbi:hypothetical protein [Acinetobacter seifertii]|uniref:PGAP1-like alpha/beta domain-containing protein n=1 Tax=Acinetobacter seifertii TaxID=1530123 RepID=UPI0032B53531